MSQLHLTPIDLNQNELRNATVQVLSSAPGSPVAGQVYYDSTIKSVREYNGTAWRNLDAGTLTDGSIANTALTTNPLARANHTGTQTSSTISDLAATVQAYTLDEFAAPAGNVSWNSHKITSLLDPTAAQDAATKNYVDNAVTGLQNRAEAFYATTATLAANTYANGSSGVGATLTGNSNGALASIDGQTINVGDQVLVKNEATASHNGIYTVTTVGTGSVPYVLTRSTGMNTSAQFGGALVAVDAGTVNAGALFLCTNNSPTVGTTSISFTEVNKGTDLSAGNGIAISTGTVSVNNGLGLNFSSGALQINASVVAQKYSASIGDGSSTSYTVNHALGNQWCTVQIYQTASPYQQVFPDVKLTDANNVQVIFTTAPTTNQYKVVVHG
jgi:hypothetical protein